MHIKPVVVLGALSVVRVSGEALAGIPILNDDLFAAVTCHKSTHGGAPEPTAAPSVSFQELIKRQSGPTNLCGVFASDTTRSLTCGASSYCGYATSGRAIFGCCGTYKGDGTLGNCYFPTTCLDYTAVQSAYCANSDTACISSTKYCSNSASPSCGRYVDTSLTAWACFPSASVSIAILSITPTGSVSSISNTASSVGFSSSTQAVSSVSSISSSSSSAAVPSGPSSSIGIPQSGSTVVVPFTQSQQTIGITTPTSSSSKALAASLVPVGETWLGYILSFVLLLL